MGDRRRRSCGNTQEPQWHTQSHSHHAAKIFQRILLQNMRRVPLTTGQLRSNAQKTEESPGQRPKRPTQAKLAVLEHNPCQIRKGSPAEPGNSTRDDWRSGAPCLQQTVRYCTMAWHYALSWGRHQTARTKDTLSKSQHTEDSRLVLLLAILTAARYLLDPDT